jgi:membrane-associated phospholipid phosphatase
MTWPASPAGAQPRREDRLRVRPALDVPVTLAAAAGFLTLKLMGSEIAPRSCGWCDRNADGRDTLNPLDGAARDLLRWSEPHAADSASDVTAYLLCPAAAFGLNALASRDEGRMRQWPADALIILQATLLAEDLQRVARVGFARARPFVHDALADDSDAALGTGAYTSFYSGHTNLAFALVVSGGTVATLRGYRRADLIWKVGLPVAALTGYLRIAGDRHYLTDVLAGAAVGSAVGFAVPYLLHRAPASRPQRLPQMTAAPLPGGAGVSLRWTW